MSNQTIVLVDDEEELRENLQYLLEFQDYNHIAFNSVEDLLEHYPSLECDLVLLDNLLPGINGIDAIPKLKAIKPSVPVVLVTATSQQQILENAQKQGADHIVLKPYSASDILQTISQFLSSNPN